MLDRSDGVTAAWITLLLLGVYLLSFSGQLYSQDSMSMFSVTESVVKRGELNTDQMWTLFKARNEIASDGESYAKYGYGISLFAVPLYALALALPDFGLVQTTLLTSAIVIAIAGALMFLAARRLRYTRGVSLALALLFGLATPAWVYAKQFWSETFGIFTLFAAFYFLLSFRQEQRTRDAIIGGVMLGLAVATRVTNTALVPFFGWYGFVGGFPAAHLPANRRNLRAFAWFALVLMLVALSIAAYNWVRNGSLLATGYRADETFDNPLLLGLYGLLFSPGKGLFVYVPFLAALPWAAVVLWKRARDELFLVLAIFSFYLLVFSAWYYWWGGTNWGPRFLLPTVPFLVLLVAPAIELAARTDFRKVAHVAFSALFLALCFLSFSFQLLGVSIPSLAYRARMIRLSANPDWDSIFFPQFSPLVGSLNLLRPSVLDFAWIRVLDGRVNVDWLIVALLAAFVALCALGLAALFAKGFPARLKEIATSRGVLLAFAAALVALALVSIYRYRDDFRFGGVDGYSALLLEVARSEQPRDVMVLNNDVFTQFFLNENRARVRWYGLSRDPQQSDDATRALLMRLSKQYARVWFAYDDSAVALPDPTHAWLDQSLKEIDQRDFADGVHLTLYAANGIP
ncbi:MAG TPA: hypothetical protein VF478_12995 [Anaerolineae bacterium]